ncbi:MAG: cytochrome c oxidase subunit II [Nitrospirae bacterium]|nr:cytochrome c oxidase subunit II [Nitrospirota bacterium]
MNQAFSNQTGNVDNIFLFITVISVVMLAIVTSLMIIFLIKFSRRKNPVATDIEGNLPLEIAWIVIPTILVLAMFYYGWVGFKEMRTPPEDAMPVKVSARMWSWAFTYENGRRSGELLVPLNKPVKLIITSEDVLHSLFIPAFRIKEDAVPGMETYLWFLPDRTGSYDLFCSEYCGTGHSSMISKVVVMPQEDFYAWYKKEEKGGAKGKSGLEILTENGCLECHTIDGSKNIGPGLKGIFGKRVTVVTRGQERGITIDEGYLKRSLVEPGADVVKGYSDIMPSQKEVLPEKEINTIVDYIKDLK